jgi:hypothetical protein
MGVSSSKKSASNTDKYSACTRIDQIPPIERTSARISVVLKNALKNIENIDSIKYLIDNHSSDFGIDEVCLLIKLNDPTLFNRFYGYHRGIVYSTLLTTETFEKVYNVSIEAKNETVLKLLNEYLSEKSGSTSDKLEAEKLAFYRIMEKFAENKLINSLISFIDNYIQYVSKRYIYNYTYSYTYSYSKNSWNEDVYWFNDFDKIMISVLKNHSGDKAIELFKLIRNKISKNKYIEIYKIACNKNKEIVKDILPLIDLRDHTNVLYIACSNGLTDIAKTIVNYDFRTITIKHFEYTPDGKFSNNTIMSMINNDMFEVFKIVMEKCFVGTGRVMPEDKDSDFGKYLIHCHKTKRENFKKVLIDNVTFSEKLLKSIKYQKHVITETLSVNPSNVNLEISRCEFSKAQLIKNDFDSNDNCEMSKIVSKIKEVVDDD